MTSFRLDEIHVDILLSKEADYPFVAWLRAGVASLFDKVTLQLLKKRGDRVSTIAVNREWDAFIGADELAVKNDQTKVRQGNRFLDYRHPLAFFFVAE